MPPRIPLFQCLRATQRTQSALAALPPASNTRPAPPTAPLSRSFTTTPTSQASTVAQKRRYRDPYAIAQAKARKAANLSRQQVLKDERGTALGDPVRGITTPFVRSFDTALSNAEPPTETARTPHDPLSDETSTVPTRPPPDAAKEDHLNFFLSTSELQQGLAHSKYLSTSSTNAFDVDSHLSDVSPETRSAQLAAEQNTASEALRRIASLSLGSSKDRLRVNTRRCIDTFGRHTTDSALPPPLRFSSTEETRAPRVGPDTGSSEVQISILTAKIRTLADYLETRGTMDKVNKRNLRLLVHRRQKLLQYLRRKEKGGPRWKNVIETLGLTEGTWRGEISL
ncbi:hypothetical protein LTR08_006340 [Meristemomyces frigidus]|nr:hypothetical protein LTR08_006340 [Meristemomyces frigidus]